MVDDSEILELLAAAKSGDPAAGAIFADLKKAFGYVGDYSKFLYGSDWPLVPIASYRRLIEAMIPKVHHHAVFRANAEHLFGLGE